MAVDVAAAVARQRLADSVNEPSLRPRAARPRRRARDATNRRAALTSAVRLARRRLRPPARRLQWPALVPLPVKGIDLGLRSATAEVAVDTARQRVTTAEGSSSRFNSTQVQERISLRQDGAYLYHPRLFTFSLGGDFGLSPDWSSGSLERRVRTGTLWSYDTMSTLLPQSATSLDLFAARQHSLLAREFAGQNEWINEQRGMTLFARRLPLPSSLTLRRELQEDTSQIGDAATRREDWRNILTYEGERGWLNQDLRLRSELVGLTAEQTPTLNYRSQDSSVRYGADFGPDLSRHFESQLRYFTRTGNTDLTTFTADEMLKLDHDERLWTEYRYLLSSQAAASQTNTTQLLSASLHHQLYDSLTTTLGGDAGRQALLGGGKDTLRSRLELAYVKQVPSGGRLNAGLGGQLEYQRDRFGVTESSVLQELHQVSSPVVLPIALGTASVETSSIVVTKTALGPVPSGCVTPSGPPVPLVLGRDYTLVNVNNFVQIIPLACSGAAPGLNPGDTLAVDYQFEVAPSMAFATKSWRSDVSVDYRWIRPYASFEQTAQDMLSGRDDGLLEDQQSRAVGVEAQADLPRLRLNLLGEASQYRASHIAYDQLRTTQLLTWPVLPELTLTLSLQQSWLAFSKPAHQARHLIGYGTLSYGPWPGLLMELSASRRAATDTLVPEERNTDLSLRLRWSIRQLEVEPLLKVFGWQRGGTRAREYRAFVQVRRRF